MPGWAYRKKLHIYTHLDRKKFPFLGLCGPMHRNMPFIPPLRSKKRGIKGKFFSIDPYTAKERPKLPCFSVDMGTEG